MAVSLSAYKKGKEYLICVDSDGCAMDTMTIKHEKCFGPCFAEEFGSEEERENILSRWNEINLYEETRGINRFLSCAAILSERHPQDRNVAEFSEWTRTAEELSESAVGKVAETSKNPVFQKAYEWSKAVNRAIVMLPEAEKKAFFGVREGLAAAKERCDIAVVSSANYAAVAEEWERCGLLGYTDVVTTQQDGSKAYCIAELIKKGYQRENVIMCGDAVGDLKAAEKNGIAFYPILVGKESQSWKGLLGFIEQFIKNGAAESVLALRRAFYENFRSHGEKN